MSCRLLALALIAATILALCPSASAQGVTTSYLNALSDFPANRGALSIAPDGRRAAFITRSRDEAGNVYVHRLHILDLAPPSRSRVIAEAGDILLSFNGAHSSGVGIDRSPLWSPDGRWIAFIAEHEGRAELWRIRPDGRALSRVAGGDADVRRFRWSEDASALLVQQNAPRASLDNRALQADLVGFHADRLFAPVFSLGPAIDASEAGATFQISMRNRRRQQVDGTSLDEPTRAGAWVSPRDAHTNVFRPTLGVFVEGENGPILCVHAGCEGRLLEAWRLEDGRVAFLRQVGHNGVLTEISLWSPATDSVQSLRRREERLRHCAPIDLALLCVVDAPLHPPRLVRIDLASGDEQTIFDPNPDWAQQSLPRIERLDITNADGLESFAHLVYPLGYIEGRRYPLVIVQYRSRGFLRAGVGGEYPVYPLSARGYFVLNVERPENALRASEVSAHELLLESELNGAERGMKLEALQRLFAILDARNLIDTSRVAITGMSDGAETLYHAITRWPIFAAAVTSSPPTDSASWWLNSERFRETRASGGLTAPWADPATPWNAWWRDASAANHVSAIWTPLLLNLAESEVLTAMPLVTRLQETARPYDLYVYPGAYHNKWRPQHIRAAQDRAIAWIDLWLRDVDTPDPREPERAARWRALRDDTASNPRAASP
jgi:dipeptidyl aminopeptidase/acylaminoacyl peptidase